MKQQQNYHGYLGYQWARRIAQSRFLRGKSVRFPQLVEAYSILFQTGAVLGRAKSTRATQLAELFAEPGRGADLAGAFKEIGKGIRDEGPSETTLFELAMTQLGHDLGVEGGLEEFLKLGNEWASVEVAARELGHALVLGVCLGLTFPDFVEQLWRKAHETPDRSEKMLLLRRELGLSEEREPFPLEEFEQQVLLELAAFVPAYYPGLVAALDLGIPGAE